MQSEHKSFEVVRYRIIVSGAVQGVGFRPFVYRLATELGIGGLVSNNNQGVTIEIEADRARTDQFIARLRNELPPLAHIDSLFTERMEIFGDHEFRITASEHTGRKSALVLPDIATCPDCLREIHDTRNRRYQYPFTNCTNCGPRFSIIESLPYDRANTTMKKFEMCDECRREYEDPADRRFHAQPNACPKCGPHLELWAPDGTILAARDEALVVAVARLMTGEIVALKGLGGFQLLVDATSAPAVDKLRQKKRRSNKPFAVMYPTMTAICDDCIVIAEERNLIESFEAPIVLVRRKLDSCSVSDRVAPGNPYLGVMLPYTPLHHLLMNLVARPLVATSGNLSEEPLCIDEHEALRRLHGIADVFLVHDRPIKRHVDDSVARIIEGKTQIIRRARGFAPMPVHFCQELPEAIAVGAHLKNTIAISKGSQVFIGQHIGDLESSESQKAFASSLNDLPHLYELEPVAVAHDLHPDYSSTIHAIKLAPPKTSVQHHYAHILSCMLDNCLEPPVLGISWDGTGLGTDGNIWGGEFLAIDDCNFNRIAHLRTFRLPGGDTAIKEPRRSAAGILFELYRDSEKDWSSALKTGAFSDSERELMWQMLNKNINSPVTTSAGRLFDGVASLVGLSNKCTFEGEAAMMLEFAIDGITTSAAYAFDTAEVNGCMELDWRPMISQIARDAHSGVPVGMISAKFHNTLVEMIIEVAKRAKLRRVALSGGCFLNRYLTEKSIERLRATGFEPYWHQQIPPNDGGISAGQILAIARASRK